MSANGDVVLERLASIGRSLSRAQLSVEAEVEHRLPTETYTATYLTTLTRLASQASELEDAIRKELSYA